MFITRVAIALLVSTYFLHGCSSGSTETADRVLFGITEEEQTVPALVVSPGSGIMTTETGGTAEITVVLSTAPVADVVIPNIASSDITEGNPDKTTLTFTSANWNVPQTIVVTGADDPTVDGNIDYNIQSGGIQSDDPNYSGKTLSVPALNVDSETAAVVVTPVILNLIEGGTVGTFTVVLSQQPTGNVTIPLTSQNTAKATLDTNLLTFTEANFDTPQTVTVTPVNNNIADGPVSTSITTGIATNYMGIDPADVAVNITDDDTAGIFVSNLSRNTTEAGQNATFNVVLTTAPQSDVVITIDETDDANNSGNSEGTINKSTLTFTPANWNVAQFVTVTPVNEFVDDGNKQYIIKLNNATSSDPDYNGLNPDDVTVNNIDNDVAGFVIVANGSTTNTAASAVTIQGFATDDMNQLDFNTYSKWTIRLRSQPLSNVTLNLGSSSTTNDGILNTSSLLFTPSNWNVAQTVSVQGASNGTNEGNHDYSVNTGIVTSDSKYGSTSFVGAPSFRLRSCDNDVNNKLVGCRRSGSFSTSEGGGSATIFIIGQSNPGCSVTVPATSSNTNEGTVTSSAVVTTSNWNVLNSSNSNKITATGVNDTDIDGNVLYNIQLGLTTGGCLSPEFNPPDVPIRNIDNEQVLDVGNASGNTTENGATATFGVRLKIAPTSNVTFTIACNAANECQSLSASELTFTPANWNVYQTITVTPRDDNRVDGNQSQCVSFGPIESTDDALNEYQAPGACPMTNTDNDRLIWITNQTYLGNFNATTDMSSIDASCQSSASDSNAPANVGSVTYKALIAHGSFRVATTTGTNGTGQSNWVLQPNTDYYLKTGSSPYTTRVLRTNSYGTFTFGSLTNAFSSSGGDSFWTGLNSNWTTSANNCGNWQDRNTNATFGVGNAVNATSINSSTASCHESDNIKKKVICVQQ